MEPLKYYRHNVERDTLSRSSVSGNFMAINYPIRSEPRVVDIGCDIR
jgi:hypothetical protein